MITTFAGSPDTIESWLDTATCGLAKDGAARVREEMVAHYESARDEALADGAPAEEADRVALAALGSAKAAKRANREVHVTAWESRLLREDEWVGRVMCSRRLWLALPILVICAAVAALSLDFSPQSMVVLVGALGMAFIFGAPIVFPITTRARGRAYRLVKWVWLIAVMWLAFSPGRTGDSWASFFATGGLLLWLAGWIEWRRILLRRKIPYGEWPRGLYL